MPETGTRQGPLCKHIRHIRHQFGVYKVYWLVGMCCCCRVNLLADGFLTQICLYGVTTWTVNLYSLARVTQC